MENRSQSAARPGAAHAIAAVATALLLGGCSERPAEPGGRGSPVLASEAREAGIIALAGPVRGTVRVLYARNGSMALRREIRLPPGVPVRELSLSADGEDLYIGTGAGGYAVSTRTGRVEAGVIAQRPTGDGKGAG